MEKRERAGRDGIASDRAHKSLGPRGVHHAFPDSRGRDGSRSRTGWERGVRGGEWTELEGGSESVGLYPRWWPVSRFGKGKQKEGEGSGRGWLRGAVCNDANTMLHHFGQ